MASPTPLLDDAERQAPRALVAQALRLVGRIHRAGPDAARAAEAELQRMRQASPAHAQAAATAQRIWNATEADGLRTQLPLPPTAAQQRRGRRRATGLLGIAALLALAGAGGRWAWLRPVHTLALRTGRAQTLAHALPDGSTIDLAARTALDVRFHRDRRSVHLASGEARFEVVRDDARPFSVTTPWGRVQVLGTVFTVSVRAERMRVAVARGRVAVWPLGAPVDGAGEPPAAVLQPGQAIAGDAGGLGRPATVEPEEVADWRQGWLVFRNTPLAEAVARWNDYLAAPLRLADDAALQALRVTGNYPLRSPQAFLDSLPAMLPVRVLRAADGGTDIAARR